MTDWFEDWMNLDLNLSPVAPMTPAVEPETEPSLVESMDVDTSDPSSIPSIHMRLHSIRERTRLLTRRTRHLLLPLENASSLELTVDSDGNRGSILSVASGEDIEDVGGTSQVGEGSVAAEDRSCDVLKTCEHNVACLESGAVEEKENVERVSEGGSFFDCNICLDLARDPIVTSCGHLFCWSCIYRWLHIHSDAKECPVCKGEVTLTNVTPIYGRGNHTHEPEEDSDVKIPSRPSGRRVESLRQTIQRSASLFPMEEMIRRIGARFELARDIIHLPVAENDSESNTREFYSTRPMRNRRQRASNVNQNPSDVVDLTQDRPVIVPQRLPPLTFRRGQSHRDRSAPVRSEEMQPSSVDDRDSFSSIAAVIHGESQTQTVDTTVEIDSMVSLSTSSSRRLDTSRGSDMDSGESRVLRRRRIN